MPAKLRMVYCGNLPKIALFLSNHPSVNLIAWIIEEGDFSLSESELLRNRLGVPVHPVADRDALESVLHLLQPIDLGVLGNFGIILHESQLQLSRKGFVNLHLGLLPEYPGRRPVEAALAKGEKTIGVTLHQVTEAVDAGPVIARRELAVPEDRDTRKTLERLEEAAARLLRAYLETDP